MDIKNFNVFIGIRDAQADFGTEGEEAFCDVDVPGYVTTVAAETPEEAIAKAAEEEGYPEHMLSAWPIKEPDDGLPSKARLLQILQNYVNTDAEAAEPEYIRTMLTDACGMTEDEIKACGFSWLFPEEESDKDRICPFCEKSDCMMTQDVRPCNGTDAEQDCCAYRR